jgi:hypothetical protein
LETRFDAELEKATNLPSLVIRGWAEPAFAIAPTAGLLATSVRIKGVDWALLSAQSPRSASRIEGRA